MINQYIKYISYSESPSPSFKGAMHLQAYFPAYSTLFLNQAVRGLHCLSILGSRMCW